MTGALGGRCVGNGPRNFNRVAVQSGWSCDGCSESSLVVRRTAERKPHSVLWAAAAIEGTVARAVIEV